MPTMPVRERREPIVGLTANAIDVRFDEASLVTSERSFPSGLPGRTSWEVVLRNATGALAGRVELVIQVARGTLRGRVRVLSDNRQLVGGSLLRTTVLTGLGDLSAYA